MSKDKQIEEMARVLSSVKRCDTLAVSECIKRKCEYPHYEGVTCIAEHQAEKLYTAGYRKAYDDHQRQCTCYALGCQMAESLKTEVARKIFEEIGELINEYLDGRSYRHEFLTKIAELKKKYTEGQSNG